MFSSTARQGQGSVKARQLHRRSPGRFPGGAAFLVCTVHKMEVCNSPRVALQSSDIPAAGSIEGQLPGSCSKAFVKRFPGGFRPGSDGCTSGCCAQVYGARLDQESKPLITMLVNSLPASQRCENRPLKMHLQPSFQQSKVRPHLGSNRANSRGQDSPCPVHLYFTLLTSKMQA